MRLKKGKVFWKPADLISAQLRLVAEDDDRSYGTED